MLGHYKIGEQLGRGGMGEVYRADDLSLDRKVALKFLPAAFTADPERMARFEREAKLLASLNHPNIATIYGLEQAEGKRFIVMELVEGETLAQRLSKGRLPIDEALGLCRQIAEGLEAAHEKGVIHRDLKPANVMIAAGDKVKLLDFGLAKAPSGETQSDASQSPTISEAMTQPGIVLGTAAYMSPEQAKSKAVDKRADIWAWGCVLYECLTARKAFEGELIAEILASVLEKEPDLNAMPEVAPPIIRHLLCQCFQKEPKRRLRDIGDALGQIDIAISESRLGIGIKTPDSKKHWLRAQVWSIALLITFVAVVICWGMWNSTALPPQPIMRFVVAPPNGVELSMRGWFIGLALSANSQSMAYHTGEGVLLHSMELGTAGLIVPGLRGFLPFFSTDGKWIGFFDNNKLMKISTMGGSPQSVCDAIDPQGGSWGADDTILFGASGSLWSISASGAGPARLVLDKTKSKDIAGDYCWPEILPGSKAVLFTVRRSEQDMCIAALSLESGKTQILIKAGTKPHYAKTGHLIYAWENDILAAPFDSKQLRVTGPSVPIIQKVMPPVWNGQALYAISETGTLAYIPKSTGKLSQLVWLDHSGQAAKLPLPPGEYGSPRISPNGKYLIYEKAEGKQNLWIYDLARGISTRLTDEAGDDWNPVWTRDSKRVAFCSTRQGNRQGAIFLKEADGSKQEERLVEGETWPVPYSWSPGNNILAFRQIAFGTTGYDIWTFTIDEKKAEPLIKTPFYESCPKYSPDGKWIAYQSDSSGNMEVYVKPSQAPSGAATSVSNGGGRGPLWSPDGSELFYESDGNIMSVAFRGEPALQMGKPTRFFKWDESTSPKLAPANVSDLPVNYDIAPDGRFICVVTYGEEKRSIEVVLNWFEELKRLAPAGKK
jgi:hypothetical protein